MNEATKDKTFLEAFRLFSLLIEEYPQYASTYNNRAQVIRWQYGDHILSQDSTSNSSNSFSKNLETALSDLDSAIRLGTPRSPTPSLHHKPSSLCKLTHNVRATLLFTVSKDLRKGESSGQERGGFHILRIPPFENVTTEMLEEASARDFVMGGRCGSEIGKAMAIHTNPYAKICGSIVKEAMKKKFGPGVKPNILGGVNVEG